MPATATDPRHRRPVRFWSPVEGEILAVTETGMTVRVFEALESGRRYTFRIADAPAPLAISGQVEWARLESLPVRAGRVGAQFVADIHFTEPLSPAARGLLLGTRPKPEPV